MDVLFFVAGLVLLAKKQINISSKRVLRGKPVKILGTLYLLPLVSGFVIGFIARPLKIEPIPLASWVSIGLIVVAIAVTVYFIVSSKNHTVREETEDAAPPADFLHLKIWLPAVCSAIIYGYATRYLGHSLFFEPFSPWFLVWLILQLIATYYTHALILRKNRSGTYIALPLLIGVLGIAIVYLIPAKKVNPEDVIMPEPVEEKPRKKLFS